MRRGNRDVRGQLVVRFLVALLALVIIFLPSASWYLYSGAVMFMEETIGHWIEVRGLHSKLAEAVEDEGLRVLVVSHGGVGTKAFSDYLTTVGLIGAWSTNLRYGLVHLPSPPTLLDSPLRRQFRAVVYIFGDPLVSVCSVKQQGTSHQLLRKLGRGTGLWSWIYSDVRLLEAMYLQFKAWTNSSQNALTTGYPILSLSSNDAFDPVCQDSICNVLGTCSIQKNKRPLAFHSRHTTRDSPCVKRLERSLAARHKRMVEEMLTAAETTFCMQLRGMGWGK